MARKLPQIISQEEFEKLFKAATEKERRAPRHIKHKFKAYRLAMLLGFEAGMRISEIVGHTGVYSTKNKKTGEWEKKRTVIPKLSPQQIEGNSIRIISGKGDKDRIVPKPKRMNQGAIDILPLKVSRRALQEFITKMGKLVLNKHITFHTLRHGFGSHLASSGRPLHEIQMLMGHSRLDTTGIYLHANPKQAIQGAQDVF